MKYFVEQVSPVVKKEVGQYKNTLYQIKLNDVDEWLDLFQKPTTAPPVAGQELEGTIKDGRFTKTPSGTPSPASRGPHKDNSDGMAWGNALTNATALMALSDEKFKTGMDAAMAAIPVCRYLFDNRFDGKAAQSDLPDPGNMRSGVIQADQPPAEAYDEGPYG